MPPPMKGVTPYQVPRSMKALARNSSLGLVGIVVVRQRDTEPVFHLLAMEMSCLRGIRRCHQIAAMG